MSKSDFRLKSKFNRIEEGWVFKRGHFRTNWNKRFFHLDFDQKTLNYYTNEKKQECKASYLIQPSAAVKIMPESTKLPRILCLKAIHNDSENTLMMYTEMPDELDKWQEMFEEIIKGVKIKQPRLCEPFHNQVPLQITYHLNNVRIDANDGSILPAEYSHNIPTIKFKSAHRAIYTLILVNPDFSLNTTGAGGARLSIVGSSQKHFAHWILCNIPENDLSAGHPICPYMPACPLKESGLQRYFFLLYKQDKIISSKKLEEYEIKFSSRVGINVCEWASKEGFGLPIGVNGFQSEWSEYCNGIHQSDVYKYATMIVSSPRKLASVVILYCRLI